MTGLRKHLYPELFAAYEKWTVDNDIQDLHAAVKQGQDFWTQRSLGVLEIYEQHGNKSDSAIVGFLEPVPVN